MGEKAGPAGARGLAAPFVGDPLLRSAHRLQERRLLRARFLPAALFGEPGWEVLLSAWIAAREGRGLHVKPLVASTGAPATTAQRWIEQLDRLGLVRRTADPADRRRVGVTLTPKGERAMHDYLAALDGL